MTCSVEDPLAGTCEVVALPSIVDATLHARSSLLQGVSSFAWVHFVEAGRL